MRSACSASTRRNRLGHFDPGLAHKILALGEEAVSEQAMDADGMFAMERTSSTLPGCGRTLFDTYDTKRDASTQVHGD